MQSCVAQEHVAIMGFKNVGFISNNQKSKLQLSVMKLTKLLSLFARPQLYV